MVSSLTTLNLVFEILTKKKAKELKGMQIGKEEVKFSYFRR
jgi:hypothetical protein